MRNITSGNSGEIRCPNMRPSTLLLLLSYCTIGVYSNCDVPTCISEVTGILYTDEFCSTLANQQSSVAALRKCIFDTNEAQTPCVQSVRDATVEISRLIEERLLACGVAEARDSCQATEMFQCLSRITAVTITNVNSDVIELSQACKLLDEILSTLDVCKNCVGGFFGEQYAAIAGDVDKSWAMVTSMVSGACDCASKIVEFIPSGNGSTCRQIEEISKIIEVTANDCAVRLIESVQKFDWLTMAQRTLAAITLIGSSACIFFGGASTASLSFPTIAVVIIIHLLLIFLKT